MFKARALKENVTGSGLSDLDACSDLTSPGLEPKFKKAKTLLELLDLIFKGIKLGLE